MPTDLTPFQQTILRICNEDGEFYGVGCLLNPHQAITCAHVVADALGYASGKVRINRPFAEENIHSVTAQVEDWYPRGERKLSDMALLQLDEPLTESVSLKLSYSMNLTGIRFKAWGGPAGHEIHLIDIEGIIGSPIGNGRYRLDVKDSNYKIEKGCSGAPVVDVETGQVLGLIAQEELDKDIPAGFLIPATHWRQTGWFPEQNAGEGLEPLKVWLNNRFKLCSLERRGIEEFVDYYTGTDENPMPFAGRSEELRHLDNWLAQNQGRLLLLSGSAGRGKSALLLHWLAQLIRQPLPDLTILFLPISIRFETSNELEGLRLLHAALCDYFADLRFSPGDKPDTHDYRQKLSEGWDRIANRPNQLYLLVIDGIDESANDWLLNKVLPRKSSANLHVLLSARHLSRETDGKSWFQKLNISGELLELPLLTQSAISEAIIQLGRPLDELAERETFVKELYRLTDQGDPLLLNLWIGQIWQYRETAPQIKIEQLQQLKPSLAGFYGKWLEDQEKIWKKQSIDDVDSSDFNQLMQVLASAYGPLLLKELVSLQKQVRQLQEEETADIWLSWDQVKLRKILTTSSRLVIGDGEKKDFSLGHPRLNDYFQTELANEPAYQRQVHEAYLNWGSEVVARLNQNKLMPDSCPRYLLHHYTEHVAAAPTTVAHLKPRDVLERYWLPLLEGGWHQAWEAYEGSWNGFLSDLQRVVQALRQYNQACYERGERAAMKLAAEVRCALIRASFHTLSQNLSEELLVELVKSNSWSLEQCSRIIEGYEEPEKRVGCLIQLAHLVPHKEEVKRPLLQKALQSARMIESDTKRVEALCILAEQRDDEQIILQEALDDSKKLMMKPSVPPWFNQLMSVEPLCIVAKRLQDKEQQQTVLQEILEILEELWRRELMYVASLEPLLATVFELLRDEEKRVRSLRLMEKIKYVETLISSMTPSTKGVLIIFPNSFLNKVGQLQDEKEKQNFLQQVLAEEKIIKDTWSYITALVAIVKQLQGKEKRKILQQLLEYAKEIKDDKNRIDILIVVAKQLQSEEKEEILQRALRDAKKIKNDKDRIYTLISLSEQLQTEEQEKVLKQAQEVAKKIENDKDRIDTLIALTEHLQSAEQNEILQQTLKKTLKVAVLEVAETKEKWYWCNILITIIAQLQIDQLQDEEKQLIKQISESESEVVKNCSYYYDVLLMVAAQQLQGNEKEAILQFFEFIKTKKYRDWEFDIVMFNFLLCVVEPLQDEEKRVVLQRTIEVIKKRYGSEEVVQSQEEVTLQKKCFDTALRRCLSIRNSNSPVFEFYFKAIIARFQPCLGNLLTYSLWKDCLGYTSTKRSELFEVTGELCTAAIQLTGNPQEANEIARAVMDVVRWWP